jgi:ribosomal protein S18 acetylase RimI-like enzyme
VSDVQLRDMTVPEFERFRKWAIDDYAAEKVRSGAWLEDLASMLAERATDNLLPKGLETPGTWLLAGEAERLGTIGFVWVNLPSIEALGAWIYYIEVPPSYRRRGFGHALVDALANRLNEQGCPSIHLNVFSDNVAARKLYESCGFMEESVTMKREL